MEKIDRVKKILHFASTAWLVVSFLYIFINALRYWGVKWWLIFSLSGYSLLVLLLLISFYLFAIYNGLVRNERIEKEHPLTRTTHYMFLYDMSPFIGALAALFAITSADNISQALTVIAIGTFAVTFIFWIVVDPILNLVEASLPQSIEYRKQRLEKERKEKQKQKLEHERLLEDLKSQEIELLNTWQRKIQPLAGEISDILNDDTIRNSPVIVDYGLKAWQIGGKECMNLLKSKVVELAESPIKEHASVMIDLNWSGIGEWNAELI